MNIYKARAHLLFQLFIVALTRIIFSLYSLKQKGCLPKTSFRTFSKFYGSKNILNFFLNFDHSNLSWVTWGPSKFGPDRLSHCDVYWIQKQIKTDKTQAEFIYRWEIYLLLLYLLYKTHIYAYFSNCQVVKFSQMPSFLVDKSYYK